MLSRKEKRRYIWLLHKCKESKEVLDLIEKRNSELFGAISTQGMRLKMIEFKENSAILRCNLHSINALMATICLTNPPMVSIGMSGTLKRLRNGQISGKDGKD